MHSSIKKPNRRILVVDDEIDVLEFLQIYLESLKWQVTTADTTSKAFELLKNDHYFLVLSDIAMPDMDGYEFVSSIKDTVPSEMIFMTGFGYNPNHTLVKINRHTKYPCLFKPFNRQKLAQSIQKAWENYHEDLAEEE